MIMSMKINTQGKNNIQEYNCIVGALSVVHDSLAHRPRPGFFERSLNLSSPKSRKEFQIAVEETAGKEHTMPACINSCASCCNLPPCRCCCLYCAEVGIGCLSILYLPLHKCAADVVMDIADTI